MNRARKARARTPTPGQARAALRRLAPLALACSAPLALAQTGTGVPWARAASAPAGPAEISARRISGLAGVETVAEGQVDLKRGPLRLQADRLVYRTEEDLATARGQVIVERDGLRLRGPELQLKVQAFEGYFLEPVFDFLVTGAGGRAQRLDFLDASRLKATRAQYTGCPRDGTGDPDWLLTARELHVDVQANEGRAVGAQLRFLGVPVLAVPSLTFPVTGARKSGWLAPQANLDNRSGLEFGVPYYWNIAPHRDATITPRIVTRRGAGVDTEFRYLEPSHEGQVALDLLPADQIAGRTRHALRGSHRADWATGLRGSDGAARIELAGARVSDDDWWKDFRTDAFTPTPRLLPLRASIEQGWSLAGVQATTYARSVRWQVLQSVTEPVAPPYDRVFQAGARALGTAAAGRIEWSVETEFNRFALVDGAASPARPAGRRLHLLADAAWPWRDSGLWVVPRLALNTARYDLDRPLADGRLRLGRSIPTFSLDAGMTLERETAAFGRALRQTLEPRLMYVRTPWREQPAELAFDSAARDFSFSSIFATSDFSGVDRVNDADQLNAGVITRLVDAARGEELLRLGLVQRLLLRDQRITPEGAPLTGRVSDLLVLGSTRVIPSWHLEGSLRWNADTSRPVRTVMSARYSPGDFRTVGLTYRFTRGLAEQWEFSGQWPISVPGAQPLAAAGAAPARCPHRWYGVGRVNYSARDARITDAIAGVELDAGCWIGRFVAERLSTGRAEATTRLLLQLELSGLGRSGAGPVRVLKDNIPGYRALREDSPPSSP